jgi:precorrin-3B synthase
MQTGDGWIVRARVGCRVVDAYQWSVVADLAESEGNGQVELTMRGNLQVRGVDESRTVPAARRLVDCGLAASDEASDRRRVVVVNPLAASGTGGCASLGRAVCEAAVLTGLEDVLERSGGRLPAKWWAIVDSGAAWPMSVAGCDVAVRYEDDEWHVIVAGGSWTRAADPLPAVLEIVDRCATEHVRARDLELRSAGAAPDTRMGWWGPRTTDGIVAVHVAPAFGVMQAADARLLAALSAESVSIRPTPERGVLLVADPACSDHVNSVVGDLASGDWIVAGDDPRRLVSTCIGNRGCGAAHVDTWAVAAGLAAGDRTHVSGCVKRCGAPGGVREIVATADGLVEWAT